jgi:hypothetical protein
MSGKKPKEAARLRRDYGRLAARLSKLNFIAQGTITERTIMRPDPEHPTAQRAYGPYYQWTWKKEGKTVTVNLTAPQAKAFQKAIDEHRKLDALLDRAMWESKGRGWRPLVLWEMSKLAHEIFPIPCPLFRLKDRTLSWARTRIGKLGIGGQSRMALR